MNLSVIIPVYNQGKIFTKTLKALFEQNFPEEKYEIIIVDDGSIDNTLRVLNSFKNKKKNLKIFKTLSKHGKGSARNLGIKNAKNEVVVFLDGDILAHPNLLREHSNWHKKFNKKNFAMVGYITWFPKLKITPFMNWLEHGGKQLAFDELKNNERINYNHFYTGNASLKKDFLIKNGLFDEDFGRNMYEDLELAYRLMKKNLKIIYNKKAIGYHFHPTNPEKYSERMIRVGKGAKTLFAKHLELKDKVALSGFNFRTIFNQIFFPIYFIIGKIFKNNCWLGFYYNAIFFRKYIEGYKQK